MASSIKYLALALIVVACGTNPEPLPDFNAELTDQEKLLVGTWQYEQVVANGVQFRLATYEMELSQDKNNAGGNRSELKKRRIHYSSDGTYQLRWVERGDYALGTEGEPNWQPNFGYWQIVDDSLYHNRGTTYKKSYAILIVSNTLERSTLRFMTQRNLGANWDQGDTVPQTEYFIKIE